MKETRIFLDEKEIPQEWYNVQPDLPEPLAPPLHPQTLQPLGPQDLAPLFCMELIKQEMSQERYIPIPDDVRNVYKLWRPSPLHRAFNLEKALDTPARIYYKNESVSPAGSHKPNTAIAQAYYNKVAGVKRLSTETGAGQWGSALSLACAMFGLKCTVYMVRASYDQKPYRKIMMQTWGGEVFASPSNMTQAGKAVLAQDPKCPGSLGLAISEAVEDAATHEDTKYALGSVLNHVLMHQTIIGLETQKQLKKAGEKLPDVLIGCVGGGSNFGGFVAPYVKDKMKGKKIKLLAVEPTSCPTLTKGPFAYDYGDMAKLGPVVKMFTLGHGFMPPSIHAGGLRYHGDSPILSLLVKKGIVDAIAYSQNPCFESAVLFARTEGILPAPESSHAIKAAIEEAKQCKATGEEKCIVFNLSGHGHFDLSSYEAYLAGKLEDYAYPEEKIKEALKDLPKVAA